MKNIILIGPPGAGKGTQAKLMSQKLGLIHISTGDLIREEQAKDTKIGKLATQLIDQGNFLPDNIVITMVKQKVIDNPTATGFIFDGFPRTVDQAKSLDEFLNQRKTPITKVILLDIADDVIKKRIAERAEKENRPDDKPEVVQTRLDVYRKQTVPVINYYKNGYLFAANRGIINIEAAKSKEEILSELETVI
jgi:adenylate kinase